MASLLYIKEIRSDTFLHFSSKQYAHKSEESWKLRDYTTGKEPLLSQETSDYSAEDIRIMAKRPGNHYLANAPYHSIADVEFWQQEINKQNKIYSIGHVENNSFIPRKEETMTVRSGLHGQEGLTFDELDFAGQARSINGQILSVERAITAHTRRAKENVDRNETETLRKCINQVSAMLERLQCHLPEE